MKKLLCTSLLGCAFMLNAGVSFAEGDGIMKASYALPKTAGDEIRKGLKEADEENAASIKKMVEKDHAEIYSILTAPSFDRKAFLAKAQDLRSLQDRGKENRDEAFAAAATQLSEQDRKTLADALEGKTAKAAHAKPKVVSQKQDDDGERFEKLAPAAGQ